MNAHEVNIPVERFLTFLDFVNQDIIHLSVIDKVPLNVIEKRIWRAKPFCGFLFKVDFNDVIGAHANIQQVLLEEIEEKEALSASANSRDDLDEMIVFCRNEAFEVMIAGNFHDGNSVLFLLDEATYFKVARVYHNFFVVCKMESRALKFLDFK